MTENRGVRKTACLDPQLFQQSKHFVQIRVWVVGMISYCSFDGLSNGVHSSNLFSFY